jgi:hypothetical protein
MSDLWPHLVPSDQFHRHQGRSALGSYMTRRGPRYLYQCRGCGDYYSESW